jgi:hypothetical protein
MFMEEATLQVTTKQFKPAKEIMRHKFMAAFLVSRFINLALTNPGNGFFEHLYFNISSGSISWGPRNSIFSTCTSPNIRYPSTSLIVKMTNILFKPYFLVD